MCLTSEYGEFYCCILRLWEGMNFGGGSTLEIAVGEGTRRVVVNWKARLASWVGKAGDWFAWREGLCGWSTELWRGSYVMQSADADPRWLDHAWICADGCRGGRRATYQGSEVLLGHVAANRPSITELDHRSCSIINPSNTKKQQLYYPNQYPARQKQQPPHNLQTTPPPAQTEPATSSAPSSANAPTSPTPTPENGQPNTP